MEIIAFLALTGTKGDVGSVAGKRTLSSVMGGNFFREILVCGNLISLAEDSLTEGEFPVGEDFAASMPSPASLVGEGILCLATKNRIS